MTAALAGQLTAADPRDLSILDENGRVVIVPAWGKSLHAGAPTVEKLSVMIESVTGRALAELDSSVIEQWTIAFLGGHWDG